VFLHRDDAETESMEIYFLLIIYSYHSARALVETLWFTLHWHCFLLQYSYATLALDLIPGMTRSYMP